MTSEGRVCLGLADVKRHMEFHILGAATQHVSIGVLNPISLLNNATNCPPVYACCSQCLFLTYSSDKIKS